MKYKYLEALDGIALFNSIKPFLAKRFLEKNGLQGDYEVCGIEETTGRHIIFEVRPKDSSPEGYEKLYEVDIVPLTLEDMSVPQIDWFTTYSKENRNDHSKT